MVRAAAAKHSNRGAGSDSPITTIARIGCRAIAQMAAEWQAWVRAHHPRQKRQPLPGSRAIIGRRCPLVGRRPARHRSEGVAIELRRPLEHILASRYR